MNTICLVVDRLNLSYLGCYGNSWIATPAIDTLAMESLVLDQAIVDTPSLPELVRSFWQGRHAISARGRSDDAVSLPGLLQSRGVRTALLTDDPEIARHPLADGFGEKVLVELAPAAASAVTEDETHFARFFAVALEWLDSADEPFFLWLHTRGMGAPWDAPWGLRERYADEGDPAPPKFTAVPNRTLSADEDPDVLLGIRQAYAAQVSLLDMFVGELTDFLRDSTLADSTMLALLSARGMPLGVHGRVGAAEDGSGDPLDGEVIHTPWLLRLPQQRIPRRDAPEQEARLHHGAALRSQAMVQPPDLMATMLDWHGGAERLAEIWGRSLLPAARGENAALGDRACVVSPTGERVVRTPAWRLRVLPREDESEGAVAMSEPCVELYVKPDDRWEINEVSDRCPTVIQPLLKVLADFETVCAAGRPEELAPLETVLIEGLG